MNIQRTLFFPMLLFPFLAGFVFYSPGSMKWVSSNTGGAFPVVKYKLNPSVIGFSDPGTVIQAVHSASDAWSYTTTGSQFGFSLSGQSPTAYPLSIDGVPTTISLKTGFKQSDNLVFSPSVPDPDCTAPACVFLWNMDGENEIVHFDIQINSRDFNYAAVTADSGFDLRNVILHAFGHALGLTHCLPGDTEADCSARLGTGMTDPPTAAAMVRLLPEGNTAKTVGNDDRAGITSLYSALTANQQQMAGEVSAFLQKAQSICNPSPCVIPEKETDPAYQLSADEITARSNHDVLLAQNGLNTDDTIVGKNLMYQHLRDEGFSLNGISAESYMLKAIDNMDSYPQQMDLPVLQASRQILAIQIRDRDYALSNLSGNLDSSYVAFMSGELKVLIQIRRRIIDEISRR